MAAQMTIPVLTLTVFVLIAALCAMAWWRRPAHRFWAIPPFSWALFGITLYAIVLHRGMSPAAFAFWAGTMWLTTCFLVLGGVWLFLWPARRRT